MGGFMESRAFRFDDPDRYTDGTPYEELARLRRLAPVTWCQGQKGSNGYWLVLGHEEIVNISKDLKSFVRSAPLLSDPMPAEWWPEYPALAVTVNNLSTFSHEKHRVFRNLGGALFTARAEEAGRHIRALCEDVLSRAARSGSIDFGEASLELPVDVVLGEFLGVPKSDRPRITALVLAITAKDDPAFEGHMGGAINAAHELYEYARQFLEQRRASPTEDFFGKLLQLSRPSDITSEDLFFAYWWPLMAGAFDTTASTIAGAVEAFCRFPDQLRRLRDESALLPLAVEECFRWVSPAIYFARVATTDVAIDENRITSGQKVVLCYAAGNRDEKVFAEPDRFDVGRSPNPHLSFGYGPYFCLGARLAATIVREFLSVFVTTVSEVEISGRTTRTRSVWMNRIRAMPVTIRPVAATELASG